MEKNKILTIVADNVRGLMNEEGVSLTELARRCKVSTGTISKIINGSMSITIPMAMTIAIGLNVDLSDITKGLINQKPNKKINGKAEANQHVQFSVGVVSINNRRITCVKDHNNEVIGTSELEGGLDLVETSSSLIRLIQEAVFAALSKNNVDKNKIKYARLNLVTQSYEFEDTRHKFINFAKKYFKEVSILSDWQITYLSIFNKIRGISLIVDKGVSLSYMNNGELKKLGGWKFPVYDLGGENWLGVETIRHTIEAAEGYVPMTELAHNVLAKFGGKIERITETCFKGAKDADIFCLFTEPLLRSYFTNDEAAKEIVTRGFNHINRSIEKVDSITSKPLKIAINGSLTDIYKPMIKKSRLTDSTNDADKALLLAEITKDFLAKTGVRID